MGIYKDEDNQKSNMEIINVADHCFYCSQPLTLPAIYWFGSTSSGSDYIFIHPKCVKDFTKNILMDLKSI